MFDRHVSATVDRAQRAALRDDLACRASESGDLERYLENGDRQGFMRVLARMNQIAAMMDAIGWQESREAPEVVTVTGDAALAAWAAWAADDLARSLTEVGPADDVDLDALSGLRAIAEAVAR